MRRFTTAPLLVALGLLLAGCGADPLNIVVLSARAPGDKCDFSDDTKYVSRGLLDLSPYVNGTSTVIPGSYYQVFSWQNNLQPPTLLSGGQVIDPGSGNDFIAETAVYEYQYSDPSVVLSPESANMHALIAAGGQRKDNSVPVDLIQPKAFAAINASTAIDTADQTLLVTFQLFGRTLAGGSKHTNKVNFPLTIRRYSTTPIDCAASALVINGGACGSPGRDQPVSCTTP